MKELKIIAYLLIFSIPISNTLAQSKIVIETSTDVLVMVPAVAGFVTILVKKNYEEIRQIVFSGATNKRY